MCDVHIFSLLTAYMYMYLSIQKLGEVCSSLCRSVLSSILPNPSALFQRVTMALASRSDGLRVHVSRLAKIECALQPACCLFDVSEGEELLHARTCTWSGRSSTLCTYICLELHVAADTCTCMCIGCMV